MSITKDGTPIKSITYGGTNYTKIVADSKIVAWPIISYSFGVASTRIALSDTHISVNAGAPYLKPINDPLAGTSSNGTLTTTPQYDLKSDGVFMSGIFGTKFWYTNLGSFSYREMFSQYVCGSIRDITVVVATGNIALFERSGVGYSTTVTSYTASNATISITANFTEVFISDHSATLEDNSLNTVGGYSAIFRSGDKLIEIRFLDNNTTTFPKLAYTLPNSTSKIKQYKNSLYFNNVTDINGLRFISTGGLSINSTDNVVTTSSIFCFTSFWVCVGNGSIVEFYSLGVLKYSIDIGDTVIELSASSGLFIGGRTSNGSIFTLDIGNLEFLNN